MYQTKTAVGRGYSVSYPVFEGDGCSTVNRFYENYAASAKEYFESLIREDRRCVCRAVFSVEESAETFTVTLSLTLRKGGRRCGAKNLTHRWRQWDGKDTVMEIGS